MNLRASILKTLYRAIPFSLKGDAQVPPDEPRLELSCVINFYGRIHLLEGILFSLAEQTMEKNRFEVILIEDRNGTKEGRETAEKFQSKLNIRYFPLTENFGVMGYSRNFGLLKTQGRYVLFLDDDTVILQPDFLTTLIDEFKATDADGIVPRGNAAYCLVKERYDFHDPYFPTSRCAAYQKTTLRELSGFVSEMIGQEDVEFVIRFIAMGKQFHNSKNLSYFHPPLIFNTISKSASVGLSFAKLRKRYPTAIWLMLLINGLRYLPFALVPLTTKWKMQGRFSLGFLLGIVYSLTKKRVNYS
jgi:glycosyltransferase involved in cell wall biosynthesis